MAHQRHIHSSLLSAVSRTLLTASAVLTVVVSNISSAQADIITSAGISGGKTLRPYSSLLISLEGVHQGWELALDGDGRAQSYDGLGDATLSGTVHAETALANTTLLELDAAYGFDRERDQSLKQEQSVGADAGLEHKLHGLTFKADMGFETFFHQDTTQGGFAPLDRAGEDFTESEAALRITLSAYKTMQPFMEAAYVRRDYFRNAVREFDGAEFVMGVTFAGRQISGDFGAIYAMRKSVAGDTSQTLGPYVDLKWQPQKGTDVSLAMSAGIDQDTTGLADLYPYYSTRLEVSKALTQSLKLSTVFDAVLEDRMTGRETELNPTVKLAWSGENGLGLHASAGLTHTRIEGELPTTDPSFEIGMSWTWGKSKKD